MIRVRSSPTAPVSGKPRASGDDPYFDAALAYTMT